MKPIHWGLGALVVAFASVAYLATQGVSANPKLETWTKEEFAGICRVQARLTNRTKLDYGELEVKFSAVDSEGVVFDHFAGDAFLPPNSRDTIDVFFTCDCDEVADVKIYSAHRSR